MFDAIVVFVSLILAIVDQVTSCDDDNGGQTCIQNEANSGIEQRVYQLRGMLRLLRIVIVFRKLSSAEKLMEKSRHGEKLQITSPAERVLRLLNQLKDNRVLPYAVRREIEYAIQKVSSNKLYEPIVEGENGQDEGKEEYSGWITQGYKHETKKKNEANSSRSAKESTMLTGTGSLSESPDFDAPHNGNGASKDWQVLAGLSDEVLAVLAKCDSLDFNVIQMESLTGMEALPILSCFVMDKHGLLDEIGMLKANWEFFVRKIAGGYLSTNSYHNATHAADVFQSASFLLYGVELQAITKLDSIECFSLLFAASIHDYEHPGTSNIFLTKTGHKLAVIYNDHNVLEMHHVAASYKLIHETKKELFLFKDMSDADYSRIREICISAVLATDYTNHFKDLGLLRSLTSRGDFLQPKDGDAVLNKDDRMLILNVALHTCDVSNPARGLKTYVSWAERVLTEFFNQGEKEKEFGLPVSNFMDRETTNIAKCQIGFINVLVHPLFVALHDFLPTIQPCIDNLIKNRMFWDENVAIMEIEMLSGRQEFPAVEGAETMKNGPDRGDRTKTKPG